MANPTYNLIGAPVVVGAGGVSSVTFSSIPNTYTDLKIVASIRGTGGTSNPLGSISFNGTGSYSYKMLQGSGSAANSLSDTTYIGYYYTGAPYTSNTFTNAEFYIPNYAGSQQKSVSIDYVGENNAATAWSGLVAGLFTSTSAITTVTFGQYGGGSTFDQYSTFYLYGISNS